MESESVIEILPLDFLGQGALLEPVDRKLHDLAVDYCSRELVGGKDLNLTKLAKVWIGMKDDEVSGISGYVNRLDVPIFRATDALVLHALAQRMNSFFADNGCRGQEVFIHVSKAERPEQRCPAWLEVLKEWNAESSDRLSIKVR
jgi:hypothetical protein